MSVVRWLLALRARVRLLRRGGRSEVDHADELAFHVAMQTHMNMADGFAPDEARRRARIGLGSVEATREDLRALHPLRFLTNTVTIVRYSARALRRAPSFTVLSIVTLALGMTAALTVFTVARAVLLRPLPFPDPDRLVMVWEQPPSGELRNFVSAFNFARWQDRTHTLAAIGAVWPLTANISGRGPAEQVDALAVSSGFFTALGVQPVLGRPFTATDDATTPPRVVVIGHDFWQRQYGGASDVIGRTLTINASSREIVGVMPPGFRFPAARAADLFTSFPVNPAAPPGGRTLMTVARLRPTATIAEARADMNRVMDQLGREAPAVNAGWRASVFPLFDETVGSVRRPLTIALASVVFLLLLAATNVANLFLIRGGRRASESALRIALGAGRRALVCSAATESALVTLSAAAVTLVIAWWLVPAIPAVFAATGALPRADEIGLDGMTIAVAIGLALVLAGAYSTMTLLQVPLAQTADALKTGARSSTGRPRMRQALAAMQVAVALVLVLAATLTGRSLAALYRVNPGFEADRVVAARLTLVPRKYTREQVPAVVARLVEEVDSIPGVTASSSIHLLPLSGATSISPAFRSDRPAPPREALPSGPVSIVSPGYFAAMGISLRGRDFDSRDRLGAPGAVIVNDAFASRNFPGENPLGKRLTILYGLTSDFEIVGVAGDVRTSTLDHAPEPAVYLAATQEPSTDVALVMRVAGPSAAVSDQIRSAVARVDPEQGVARIQPLSDVLTVATARPRIQAGVFGASGLFALVIAAIGLYGVISYSFEQRRREIGIQMALGAAPRMLVANVMREAMVLTIAGGLVGLVMTLVSGRWLEDVLFATPPQDIVSLAGVFAVLLAAGAVAAAVPAHRAMTVDPLSVLRKE